MQNEQYIFFTNEQQEEINFLNTFPLISRFTLSRLRGLYRDQAEDLVQRIGLNLWRWRMQKKSNQPDAVPGSEDYSVRMENPEPAKDLTAEEWLKIANTATSREINSFYRSKYRREVQLEAAIRLVRETREEAEGHRSLTCAVPARLEGNSCAEMASLLKQIWRIIESFPLQRRYVYLLTQEEMLIDFITHGCASGKELAEFLEITPDDFDIVVKGLPFSDEQIAARLTEKSGVPVGIKQIRSWRAKAKTRLAEKLKEVI